MSKIIAIDLFCGAGGLTRGFRDAGIYVAYGVDILTNIKKVYEKNNRGTSYLNRDIKMMSGDEVKHLLDRCNKGRAMKTMLAGCAPCQPFSIKNRNHKREGSRETLIDNFGKLVEEVLPDIVFMENVPGVKSCRPGTFGRFIEVLETNNYRYDYRLVDAAHYGVPQHRKRLILIAGKENKDIDIPEGDYDGIGRRFKTVRDAIGKLPPIDAGTTHGSIKNHRVAGLSSLNKRRIRATATNGGDRLDWDKSLWLKCHYRTEGFKDTYARMYWDRPSPTLTTRFFSYSTGRYGHPEQDRAISIKEGALLQSFPANYKFEVSHSIPVLAQQIGNAVPPKMAKAFGEYILSLA